MDRLKIVYFGTPNFSARFLEKLLQDTSVPVDIRLVVTQPDQPVGRKQIFTKTPVKIVAERQGVEVFDSSIKNSLTILDQLKNMDLAFLFAYGSIIPKNLLDLPKYGFLNTHPSLLPKYRGPGPIAYPLFMGDAKTGVTLIRLDAEIDHGPIVAQEELEINPQDKRPALEEKLTNLAFELFKRTLLDMYSQSNGLSIQQKIQDHSKATFTRQMTKDDGFIPFSLLKKAMNGQQAKEDEVPSIIQEYFQTNKQLAPSKVYSLSSVVNNLFRGLYPWPGIWTKIILKGQEKRLKINDLRLVGNKITLNKVQLEGKKEVDFNTFTQAYPIF